MKKKLLLLSLVPLLLTSCGGENPTEPAGPGGTTTDKSVVKYTVTFVNTDMPSVQIEEGKTLAKPSDPEKANYLFVGWFMDAAFTTEVQFPLTITKDTSIYANFYSYQNAFEKARDNTIGEKVPGYEYDYTLQVTANYSNIAFNGNTTGNAKYVENLIIYYTKNIFTNVDTDLALSIGAAESGYYTAKYMLKCNNIYGGMGSHGLIKYRSIENGVYRYIRYLSINYISKGLTTLQSIGRVYCPTTDANGNRIASPHWISLVTRGLNHYSGFNYNITASDVLASK